MQKCYFDTFKLSTALFVGLLNNYLEHPNLQLSNMIIVHRTISKWHSMIKYV